MAELKTKLNDQSPWEFLETVDIPKRKEDALFVTKIMKEITGEEPKMWGASIIGFGSYRYKTKSGQEGDWMKIGLSPRKASLTLYLSYGFERHTKLLEQLGKHKIGKACFYIKKIEDVDENILRKLIKQCYDEVEDDTTA